VVLVGGVGLLLRVSGTERPIVSSSPLTWSRVPYDKAVFGGEYEQAIASVTVGGSGLVAVGQADPDAAVWTSSDGMTWSRVPHDEDVFGGASMNGVTVGGPGLVAVGDSGLADAGQVNVWTSPDGITWSRVPHDEAVFGGRRGVTMRSVAVFSQGLVEVGSDGVHATYDPQNPTRRYGTRPGETERWGRYICSGSAGASMVNVKELGCSPIGCPCAASPGLVSAVIEGDDDGSVVG
jgi:hypothetical protein